MPDYWLDSNTFIEAKKGPYAFDLAPGFWNLIENQFDARVIACPLRVFDEISDGDDDDDPLIWARAVHGTKLAFLTPCEAAQEKFTEIADWVQGRYPSNQAAHFLSKADPWVIAQAAVHRGTVVTMETLVNDASQKPKVPNVCNHFGVPHMHPYALLRVLNMRLT